jgi:transcriptional regulator of acetoin/glycerol metabolism
VRINEEKRSVEDHGDIARIVKETINALHGKSRVDERTRTQYDAIMHTLAETRGRVGGPDGAAVRLGINRTTLLARMKKLGIDPRQLT